MRVSLNQLNEFKPLEEIETHDIFLFVNHIRDKYDYKESTIDMRKSCIKRYFKDNDMDLLVKRVKLGSDGGTDLNPADIFVAPDINLIIENLTSPMYQALVAVLWESGGRISEVLAIKKDIDLI